MRVRFLLESAMVIFLAPMHLNARDAITIVRIPGVAVEMQILMGGGKMNREAMILESEAILDDSKDTAFIKVQFAESQAVLNIPLFIPTGEWDRHGTWAPEKKRWNGASLRYAELISVKGNAVLRIRDGLQVKTIVVRGQNPLLMPDNGENVEFVHFGMVYNSSKTAAMWIDASAVVPKGGLDVELAKRVVHAAQAAMGLNLAANVTMREDRFCVFTPKFAHSLLFDVDAPPDREEWSQTPDGECGVNKLGNGYCSVFRPPPGRRQRIEF